MTHDRFEKISQYFHANDHTQYDRNDPNHDKIFLVRPIFTIVADTGICTSKHTQNLLFA